MTDLEQILAALPAEPNWGHDGLPTTDAAKDTVRALSVTPLTNGGVQVEWHCHGADVEIEIGPSGAFDAVLWGKAAQRNDG